MGERFRSPIIFYLSLLSQTALRHDSGRQVVSLVTFTSYVFNYSEQDDTKKSGKRFFFHVLLLKKGEKMILSAINSAHKSYAPFSMHEASSAKKVSFAQKIDNIDKFICKDGPCQDKLEPLFYSRNNVHLLGTLDGKDYNIRFEQTNPKNKKSINICGYFDHKRLDVKADYKNNKHHYYKGTYDGQNFQIEFKEGRFFSINSYLKGKLNGKDFYAKFPSASAVDANRNLMLLLLHFSGFMTSAEGYNFSVTEPSNFSYAYFKGRFESCPRAGTLFEDIWKDPVPGPVSV